VQQTYNLVTSCKAFTTTFYATCANLVIINAGIGKTGLLHNHEHLNIVSNRGLQVALSYILCIAQRRLDRVTTSGVASPKIWRGPKKFGRAKMFDFRRMTLFCLEKRLSKHKITIFSKNLGCPRLRLWLQQTVLFCCW